MNTTSSARLVEILWDPHVHAAPSSRPRWGTDLDLVDAANEHGVHGFVLKSHHEATASRAEIANAYARRIGTSCRAIGSVVLNPWITVTELERAVALGARVVWWPTLDEHGRETGLPLPGIHDRALRLLAEIPRVVVATGHLKADSALDLVRDASAVGLRVIASHPYNPRVGMSRSAAETLAAAGAAVEIDALSMLWLAEGFDAAWRSVGKLLSGGATVIVSSDGGQRETGEPFAFLAAQLERALASGFLSQVEIALHHTNELLTWLIDES